MMNEWLNDCFPWPMVEIGQEDSDSAMANTLFVAILRVAWNAKMSYVYISYTYIHENCLYICVYIYARGAKFSDTSCLWVIGHVEKWCFPCSDLHIFEHRDLS